MALHQVHKITVFSLGRHSNIRSALSTRFSSLYEPDYLQTGKSKFPLLSTLNIQIKSYNYPVLESYQAFIHKLANIIQIDIDDCWALPSQEFKILRYKTRTTAIASEYNLKLYERDIQMSEVSAIKCSILIRILETVLPQGVNLNVDIFEPALEKKRYIPDKELLDLKSTLNILTNK